MCVRLHQSQPLICSWMFPFSCRKVRHPSSDLKRQAFSQLSQYPGSQMQASIPCSNVYLGRPITCAHSFIDQLKQNLSHFFPSRTSDEQSLTDAAGSLCVSGILPLQCIMWHLVGTIMHSLFYTQHSVQMDKSNNQEPYLYFFQASTKKCTQKYISTSTLEWEHDSHFLLRTCD